MDVNLQWHIYCRCSVRVRLLNPGWSIWATLAFCCIRLCDPTIAQINFDPHKILHADRAFPTFPSLFRPLLYFTL